MRVSYAFPQNDLCFWNPPSREVVLEVEISRERVPLRNAYRHIGQTASVRVNGGVELEVSGGGHPALFCPAAVQRKHPALGPGIPRPSSPPLLPSAAANLLEAVLVPYAWREA